MTIIRPLIAGTILAVFAMFSMIFLAVAFNGPTQAPPSGSGAVVVDANNMLAVGTSTARSNTRLYVVGSGIASEYGLRVQAFDGTNNFVVRNDGRASVTGGLSLASWLSVVGSTTFNGQTYIWPGTTGVANSVLMTDGAGNLSWSTSTGGGGTTYQ